MHSFEANSLFFSHILSRCSVTPAEGRSAGACPGPGLVQPTVAQLGLGSAWAASRCLWSGSLEPLGAGKGCGRPGGAPSKAIYEGPHPHGHYGGGCSGLLPRPPACHF